MTAPTPTVSRRELTWVLVWAAFVMLLTCIPYVYALKLAAGRTFGGFLWGVDEGNVYLAWMRQAAEGEIFFRNQYALVPEIPRFLNLFLQFGGRLGGLLHLSMPVMFHVLRLLGGVFLLVSLYRLVAELTADRVARWAALTLASLGSGCGWLIVLVFPHSGVHPVDVGTAWQIQPEAVTFASLMLNGLFTTSMALMCLTFLFALRAVRDNDQRAVWWGGLCLLVLGNIHTYDAFPVWLALGVLAVMAGLKRALKPLGLIVLTGLPSVAWALYANFSDPAFLAKGLTPTPAFRFTDYAVAYGLIGVLAAVGAALSLRGGPSPLEGPDTIRPAVPSADHQSDGESSPPPAAGRMVSGPSARLLPVVWAVANALVLLVPVSFQRKMIEGLHLPLCILAGFAVSWIAHAITRSLRERGKHKHAMERLVLTVCMVAALTVPSNALLVSQCLEAVKTNNAALLAVLQPPLYLDPPDAAALDWLKTNARREDVVLSSSLIGSFIPTVCPAKVWVGHWAETMALETTTEVLSPHQPIPRAWWHDILTHHPDNEIALRRFEDQLKITNAVYGLRWPHQGAITSPADLRDQLDRRFITLVYYGAWEQALTRSSGTEPATFEDLAGRGLQTNYDTEGVRIYRVPPVKTP